MKKQAIVDGF